MKFEGYKSVLLDIDRPSEFSGDDVDQFSELVDLGGLCSAVSVQIPTIDSATVAIYAQENGLEATVPKAVHYRQASDNATALAATTASTGGIVFKFDIGAAKFIRIKTGANQTADRTFRVCGVS